MTTMNAIIANNATSRLQVSLNGTQTTLTVLSGEGDKFPSLQANEWFPVTVVKGDATFEIMRCTSRSNDILTVVRAREGTGALSFAINDRIELRYTKGVNDDVMAGINGNHSAGEAAASAIIALQNEQDVQDLAIAARLPLAGGTMTGDLAVSGNITTTGNFGAAGSITAAGNITAYSDARLKREITKIPDALEKVMCLNGYIFKLLEGEKKFTGVIAQEVNSVLPEVIEHDSEGIMSVAYGNLAGLLIEAIKEQQAQIDELKRRIG